MIRVRIEMPAGAAAKVRLDAHAGARIVAGPLPRPTPFPCGGLPDFLAADAVLEWLRAAARERGDVRIGAVLGPEAAAMTLAGLRRARTPGSGPPPPDGA